MCDLCEATELKSLTDTLRDYLRPGVRLAVKYALSDNDNEILVLFDDETKTAVTLSTVGSICWEAENYGNVVKLPVKTNVVSFPISR